jgi:hypothetical protein
MVQTMTFFLADPDDEADDDFSELLKIIILLNYT